MALIFRSILEVEADDFVASAPALFTRWLQRKFRDNALEVAGVAKQWRSPPTARRRR